MSYPSYDDEFIRQKETARILREMSGYERQSSKPSPGYGLCPVCGGKLVMKDSVNGPFWGCPKYPNCKGNRDATERERNNWYAERETQRIRALEEKLAAGQAHKQAQAEKKEERKTMATPKTTTTDSVTAALKKNLNDAAWRTASETAVDLVRKPVAAALVNRTDSANAAMVAAFLDSEVGAAFLSALLGVSPLFLPQLGADPRVARLADEMRTSGAKFVTDKVSKDLAGPIVAAFTQAVAGLPPLPASTETYPDGK